MDFATDRVVVQFVADTEQVSRAIRSVESAARRVSQGARSGGSGGGSLPGLSKEASQLEEQFKDIEKTIGRFQRGFRRMSYDVQSGGALFGRLGIRLDIASMAMWKFTIAAMPLRNFGYTLGAIAIGAGMLVANLTKAGAWLEVTRRQFQNMTASVALANQKIEWLRDQAPKIVYSLQEVVEAGRILTSAGYDIQALVYPMADLAAGLNQQGITIVEATRAFVDGMHGEIRRLKNTFNISQNDIIKFSKATSWVLFQELGVAERQSAILSAIQERYPEANKAALESVLGAWSDFKDQISRLSQEIGKQMLGPVKWLVDRVRGLVNWLVNLSDGWKNAIAWTVMATTAFAGVASITALAIAAAISIAGLVTGIRIWYATGRGAISQMIELHLRYAAVMTEVAQHELILRGAEVAALEEKVVALNAVNAAAASGAGATATGAATAGAAGAGARAGITAGGVGMAISRVFIPLTIAVGGYYAMKLWATYAERKAIERLVASTEKAADAIQKTTVVAIPEATQALVASMTRARDLWMQVDPGTREEGDVIRQLIRAGATPAEAASMVASAKRARERMGEEGMMPGGAAHYLGEPTQMVPRPLPQIAVGWGQTPGYLTGRLEEIAGEYVQDIEQADQDALTSIQRRIRRVGEALAQEEEVLETIDGERQRVEDMTQLTETQRRARLEDLDVQREAHAKEQARLQMLDAELRAIQDMTNPAEELKRYDERRHRTALAQAVTLATMLEIMDDMEKKDADRVALLDKAYSAYGATKRALDDLLDIRRDMNQYDEKGKEIRDREIAQLQRQLGILRAMGSAAAAAYRLSEMEPWAKVFGAAGGAAGIASGITARAGFAKAAGLFAAARGAEDPAERMRLEREGAAALEDALRGQAALRKEIHDYALGQAELEGDAIQRARMTAIEHRRYAEDQTRLWGQQEAAMRRMQTTGEEIAAARKRHDNELKARTDEIQERTTRGLEAIDRLERSPGQGAGSWFGRARRGLEEGRWMQQAIAAGVDPRRLPQRGWAAMARRQIAGRGARDIGAARTEARESWQEELANLRKMGATEADIAAARAVHEQKVAEARAEEVKAYRTMVAAQIERQDAMSEYAALWGVTVAQQRESARALARLHMEASSLALVQGDITSAINEERLAREALLTPQEKALSIAEARLQLAEDMHKQELVSETEVSRFRMGAVQAAYNAMQRYAGQGLLNTEEGIAAYRKYIDIMYGGADKTKDKFKGLIDQVIGAPQELIQRYLSPASIARFFGGANLSSLLGGPGRPTRVPEVYVHNVIRIEGLPQNLVRVVDTRIQQSWRAALPALRTA